VRLITDFLRSWLRISGMLPDHRRGAAPGRHRRVHRRGGLQGVRPALPEELFTALGVSVRFFHNDSPCKSSAPHLHDTGINLYNMGIARHPDRSPGLDGREGGAAGQHPAPGLLAAGTASGCGDRRRAAIRRWRDTRRVAVLGRRRHAPRSPERNIRAFLSKVSALVVAYPSWCDR